jgi:type VI secretion system secreted protein Hcp
MTKPRFVASLLMSACAVALLLPASAPAAQDFFLKLDGIPGESPDVRHTDEIEVLSYSWGVTATDGARAKFADFSFNKRVDRASPQLFVSAASGQAIGSALLTVRKAGQDPMDYLTYCMTDVRVTAVSTAGNTADDAPTEQVSLSYGTFFESYRRQNRDGSLGSLFTGGFDLGSNTLLETNAC